MEQLLLFAPFLIPVVVANFGERHRLSRYGTHDPHTNSFLELVLRYLPHALLVAINLGLLGITFLALLNGLVQVLMPEAVGACWPAGCPSTPIRWST